MRKQKEMIFPAMHLDRIIRETAVWRSVILCMAKNNRNDIDVMSILFFNISF